MGGIGEGVEEGEDNKDGGCGRFVEGGGWGGSLGGVEGGRIWGYEGGEEGE